MGEERKIYPLKFCSIRDERPWGYEEFKLADLGYKDSLIREGWLAGNSMGELMDTYIDRIVGDTVYEYYGRQFPVCVRLLKLTGKMPLQVHPDDETAEQRYDLLGKEKLWYILKAGKGGRLHIGFRKDTDAGAFCENCGADRADTMLTDIVPVEGQSFLIPAGTPHCADGELEILEIAESSPLDFCLHGRGMEVSEDQFDPSLGFTDALDFISYRKYVPDNGRGTVLAEIPQFSIRKLELGSPTVFRGHGDSDSFVLFSCVRGKAELQIPVAAGAPECFSLEYGDSLLVPAECRDFNLVPMDRDTVLLQTTNSRIEPDKYIDPDVPAELPGQAA